MPIKKPAKMRSFAGARGVENSCAVANFKDSVHCNDGNAGVSRVGRFQPYGDLYDVSGNVAEWIWNIMTLVWALAWQQTKKRVKK